MGWRRVPLQVLIEWNKAMDIIKDFVIKKTYKMNTLLQWGFQKLMVLGGRRGKLPALSGGETFYQVVRAGGGVILTI